MLQFHLEAFEFMTIHCALWTTKFYTFILYKTMHLLSLPSQLSSLLPTWKTMQKNQQEQVTEQFTEQNQAYVGMDPTKLEANHTTAFSHHPNILCNFPNYTHHKTFYMHLAWCTLTKWMQYSALLTPQPSALKTIHICHVQQWSFTT